MKNSTTGNPPYGEVNASSGWWNAYNEKVNIIFNFSEKPGYFRTLKMRYLLHNPEDLHAHLILPPSLLQRQYLILITRKCKSCGTLLHRRSESLWGDPKGGFESLIAVLIYIYNRYIEYYSVGLNRILLFRTLNAEIVYFGRSTNIDNTA